MNGDKRHWRRGIIGLIPAAGKGRRLPPLPCSKELYPIGYDGANLSPKVVSQYLLENMRAAGIRKAFIVLRKGKWDIPAYFGDGKGLDMHLGYLLMDLPYGVPYTLDQAYPFVSGSSVALGFPDIIFEPAKAFLDVLAKQKKSNADITLGLFRTPNPNKADMVDIDCEGRVASIEIKPSQTSLKYSWGIAVWGPPFTEFMHGYVQSRRGYYESNSGGVSGRELFVGDVILAAIGEKMKVNTVIFEGGNYLDIGTAEDLVKAVRSHSG